MHAFEKSIHEGQDTLEFDIWLSSDDQLVVMHGGDNGELPGPYNESNPNASVWETDQPSEYIFEHNYEEIQDYHKKSKYYLAKPS